MSQPIAATSIGIWPTAWPASTKYGTPAARVTRPTAATSLSSPPLAGSHVTETRRTRLSSMLASATASTLPSSRHGIASMMAPVRSAAAITRQGRC
jgi:hypothetical protein